MGDFFFQINKYFIGVSIGFIGFGIIGIYQYNW